MWRDAVARDLTEAGYAVVATAADGAQALQPTDEQGLRQRRLAGELDVPQAGHQLGEQRLQLHAGQHRAQAEVNAEAEGEVIVR